MFPDARPYGRLRQFENHRGHPADQKCDRALENAPRHGIRREQRSFSLRPSEVDSAAPARMQQGVGSTVESALQAPRQPNDGIMGMHCALTLEVGGPPTIARTSATARRLQGPMGNASD